MSKNLNEAKRVKNDEFYTKIEDIQYYMADFVEAGYFKDKSIILPCDDFENSAFWEYFFKGFKEMELKKIGAVSYTPDGIATMVTYDGEIRKEELNGEGSILSEEVQKIAEDYDTLITNPPFSLSVPMNDWLFYSGLDFIVINALTSLTHSNYYKPLITGMIQSIEKGGMKFYTNYERTEEKSVSVIWTTNILGIKKMKNLNGNETIHRVVNYTYDGETIWNVNRLIDLPKEYDDRLFAVPVTILAHDFSDFEILGLSKSMETKKHLEDINEYPPVSGFIVIENGKDRHVFERVLVRMRK